MKKILLKLIATLVLIFNLVPLFLAKKVVVSRAIQVSAPNAEVHRYLTDLNQFVKWNPFWEVGKEAKVEVTGMGTGSTLSWQGEETGDGQMTITAIEPEKSVHLKLVFIKPMPGEAIATWDTEPLTATTTRMTWSYEQELSYYKRYFGLFMDKMMGELFQKGFDKLKSQIEKT